MKVVLFLYLFIKKERRSSEQIFNGNIYYSSTVILGYIVWILKSQKAHRDANSKGTMVLLKVKLFEYHDKYMELGFIPSYAYENFCDMYESYHELGGNGTGTKMYEEIKQLHLRNNKGE